MGTNYELGKPMRDCFEFNPEMTFLDHGAYGAVPKSVQSERFRLLREQEDNPVMWFHQKQFQYWQQNLKAATKYLGSNLENLVFVRNATMGINTVLSSLTFKAGDAILTHTYTYKAVRNACVHTARRADAEVLTLDMRPPIKSDDEIAMKYDKFLTDHPNVQLVLLDYICSVPPIKFPVAKLIPVLRKHNVLILVDGAHTPGQVDINLEELGVDFYTGNLHKWLFTPRPCAVLWISPKFHDVISPLVISHLLESDHLGDFSRQGTVDDTPYYCTEKAIEFVCSIGGQEAYTKYCSELADKAADLLVEKFGTEKLSIPKELEAPFMRMIRLPKLPKFPATEEKEGDVKTVFGPLVGAIEEVCARFHVVARFNSLHSEPWIRISCNVYNSIEDYEQLAEIVLQMSNESE